MPLARVLKPFALSLLLALLSSAQPPATVHGLVTDSSGAFVPGATVVVSGSNGTVKTMTTDSQGRYSLAGLPQGAYTVRVSATGFGLFEKTGVELSNAQNLNLDAQLTVALEKQEITVAAEDTQQKLNTDPANNVGALVLKGADLDTLSDDPDELESDLQALAGPAAGPNGGQIYIDGFSGGRLPPKESIREIRINSNPFAAEYDKLGFGRIEIFTKPGSDKFRGQAFFNFGDKVLNARNPFATTQPPFQSRQFGGNLSGPLGKKASFFFDGEERDIDENALVVASILDANLNITPFNTALVTPIRRTTLSPRVDYQINATNTLSARYTYTTQSFGNQGVGQFTLPSRAYSTNNNEQSAQITETSVLNAHTINETRFQYLRVRNDQLGVSTTPTINVSGSFTDGGSPFGLNYANNDSYELQNYTSLTKNTHQIKFGVRLRGYREQSSSSNNYNGTFTFTGGNYPVLSSANQIALDASGNPITTNLQSIQAYQQTQLLLRQGLTAAKVQALGYGPKQFTLTGGTPLAGVDQFDAGIFVQDDWRIRPNVTLSGGLRYEMQTNIGDKADLSPRIGVAWAPGGSKGAARPKMVVRGGFGIFYDRFSQDLTLNAERFNGSTEQQFFVNNPTFYPVVPTVASLQSSLQTQAVYQVDPHLRSPYILQSAIGIERQLPKNITLSLNYTNSRGSHQLMTRNINAPLPGTYNVADPTSGVRPYGNTAGNIYQYESAGVFKQNQLLTSVQARITPKFSMFGFYVFGKAESNTDGVGTFPSNSYDLHPEFSRAGFDVRHRAFIGGNISAPWGVTFFPFIILNSGMPFNVTTGRDLNGDGIFTDRPAFATDLSRQSVIHTAFGVFDTNPIAGQTIVPRNYGQGPSNVSINLRMSRTWGFGERKSSGDGGFGGGPGGGGGGPRGGGGPPGGGNMGFGGPRGGPGGMFGGGASGKRYTLTASISARNLLNHVNYGLPVGDLSSPFFGQSTSIAGGFGPGGPGGAAGNRKLELQVRFTF